MISQHKKHKRVKPVPPIVSSFTPPNRQNVHSECTTRPMTAEEWAKYGPLNPMRRNKSHYMMSKKGSGKSGAVRNQGKANGRGKNDAAGKVESQGSTKVSGL